MGREEGGGFRMGNTCFKIIKLKKKCQKKHNSYLTSFEKVSITMCWLVGLCDRIPSPWARSPGS